MAEITRAELLELIVAAADERHAVDLVVLDLSELCSFCDYFVICSGESMVQVRAIAESVEDKLRSLRPKVYAQHIEGAADARWILMDYGDVLVHVFGTETREFYRLERLWAAAPRVEFGAAGGQAEDGDAAAAA